MWNSPFCIEKYLSDNGKYVLQYRKVTKYNQINETNQRNGSALMKTGKIIKMVALTLTLMLMMTGCVNTATVRSGVVNLLNTASPVIEEVAEADCSEMDVIEKAAAQYYNQDHTPSENPVVHKMLWLGYTNVSYENINFRMDEVDKTFFKDVANSFEHVVEDLAEHNVDIQIDLYFVEEERELTLSDEFFYLDQATVEDDIQLYNVDAEYDSVITAVQSGGDENYFRNCDKDLFFEYPVIMGLNTKSIDESYGYSTFDLGDPYGQIFFDDPSIPSCTATAVAVHEWMHQFEEIGYTLGVEMPCTHAYMGGEEFAGYETYECDANGYVDYFEFYGQVLSGTVPYTDVNGDVHQVGMYPEMWKLTTTEFWLDYNMNVLML